LSSAAKIPVLLMARELHIGGSERQMTETAKWLDRSIFEPHVGCFRPAGIRGDELREFGVSVVQFPVYSYRSPAALRQAFSLIRYVRQHRIRIVHTWDYPLNVYAVPIARLGTGAVAISSQRSHRDLIPPGYRRLIRFSDRMAHAVVVNCEYLRRHLIEEGVLATKIQVCANGIDLERFHRRAVEHPLTVGVVCALRPEKDLGVLIDAVALLRDAAPRLLIVGDGPERDKLERRARAAKIACQFEPAADDVTSWLSAIDIFVLPSRSEALANSLIEAMACGCCVVASDAGGNPELIKDEETGILFKTGDAASLAGALRGLIADGEARSRLASAACAFVHRNFSMAEAARRMQEIYFRFIAKRNPETWSDTSKLG